MIKRESDVQSFIFQFRAETSALERQCDDRNLSVFAYFGHIDSVKFSKTY